MKPKQLFFIAALALVATIIYYALQGTDNTAYVATVEKLRKEKEEFFRTSKESPVAKDVANFKGLNYYAPDPAYKVRATLTPVEGNKTMSLPESSGSERVYRQYAHAEFFIRDQRCQLLILEVADDSPQRGTLFLAFADSTSALETYGAGRYLDIKKSPGASSIWLDFNEAYNPYCAYSDNYSCPLPPRENILAVAIRAGEKKYHP